MSVNWTKNSITKSLESMEDIIKFWDSIFLIRKNNFYTSSIDDEWGRFWKVSVLISKSLTPLCCNSWNTWCITSSHKSKLRKKHGTKGPEISVLTIERVNTKIGLHKKKMGNLCILVITVKMPWPQQLL